MLPWASGMMICLQVSAVLDRKEALLMQLRNMNDEAEAGLHLDNTGRHTEAFQVQYAQIVLELKQVRISSQSALFDRGHHMAILSEPVGERTGLCL